MRRPLFHHRRQSLPCCRPKPVLRKRLRFWSEGQLSSQRRLAPAAHPHTPWEDARAACADPASKGAQANPPNGIVCHYSIRPHRLPGTYEQV